MVEGEGGLEEGSSYDGQPRRNSSCRWREVVVVEEELKSEAGDRFLTSEPGFRGTPKACDLFPARGPNVSRLGFGPETRRIPKACDLFPARGPNASRLDFRVGNSANSDDM